MKSEVRITPPCRAVREPTHGHFACDLLCASDRQMRERSNIGPQSREPRRHAHGLGGSRNNRMAAWTEHCAIIVGERSSEDDFMETVPFDGKATASREQWLPRRIPFAIG